MKHCYHLDDYLLRSQYTESTLLLHFSRATRSGAGLPHGALARERAIAQAEIARLLRATVSDLERRLKRGKR